MNDYLLLGLGILCAGIGGELFVRGAVGIARWARIAPGIIGATVAAFATSSPELSVAISSALRQEPEIALGDALGSNVVNIGLILAVALLFSGIQAPRDSIRRDFPVALLASLLIAALGFDGQLSRLDGFVLFGVFATWLVAVTLEARRQRSYAEEVLGEPRHWLATVQALIGLAFLVAAGRLIVNGAVGIAHSQGWNEFLIGATIVAIGTSMPELATTVMAKVRGHDEVGLGTIWGSNIFNTFAIIAVAAIITPITVEWSRLGVVLLFGLITVASTYPTRTGWIERWRGVLLLTLYAVYLIAVFQQA